MLHVLDTSKLKRLVLLLVIQIDHVFVYSMILRKKSTFFLFYFYLHPVCPTRLVCQQHETLERHLVSTELNDQWKILATALMVNKLVQWENLAMAESDFCAYLFPIKCKFPSFFPWTRLKLFIATIKFWLCRFACDSPEPM